MCISKVEHPKCKHLNRSRVGMEIHRALKLARFEDRLVYGLLECIPFLDEHPEDTVLCFIPQSKPGDSGMHMQMVLLQAICCENNIPVIQVDCVDKLATICGVSRKNMGKVQECFCAVIRRDPSSAITADEDPPLTPSEQYLTDYYDCTSKDDPNYVITLEAIGT